MLRLGFFLALSALGSDLGAAEVQVNPNLAPPVVAAKRTHRCAPRGSKLYRPAAAYPAHGWCTHAQQEGDPTALMTVSQEGCQHGADNPVLGELVKFSAEPQLAELRCLDGGAAQGISLWAAGAGSSGSAAAVFRTGAQVHSPDYKLIHHMMQHNLNVTAGHAEGNLSVMPELQMGDDSLINDINDIQPPVTKLDDTVLVEDTAQVSAASGHPIAALFARVVCPSAPVAFASAGCRPFFFFFFFFFFFCLVLSSPFASAPAAVLDLPALQSSAVQGSSFASIDSYR